MNPKKPKRVALYLRVSTSEQTTRNQRRELYAVAERHGWHVVATYEDAGVSGAKGRDKRPGFDRLMMAVARREIDMVAAWSVDRLGRSLTDLLSFLTDLHGKRRLDDIGFPIDAGGFIGACGKHHLQQRLQYLLQSFAAVLAGGLRIEAGYVAAAARSTLKFHGSS